MTAPNPSSRDLDLALEALLGLRGRVVQIPDDVDAIAALLARVRAEARAEGVAEMKERAAVIAESWGNAPIGDDAMGSCSACCIRRFYCRSCRYWHCACAWNKHPKRMP